MGWPRWNSDEIIPVRLEKKREDLLASISSVGHVYRYR